MHIMLLHRQLLDWDTEGDQKFQESSCLVITASHQGDLDSGS